MLIKATDNYLLYFLAYLCSILLICYFFFIFCKLMQDHQNFLETYQLFKCRTDDPQIKFFCGVAELSWWLY